MDLQISVFFLFILFTAGHSLRCYQCSNMTGSCVDKNETCAAGFSKCMSITVSNIGQTNFVSDKNCTVDCLNGSINNGITKMSFSCCNTDLCNVHNASDPSTLTPNGMMCYFCIGQNCSNKVNCSGSEDRCYTGAFNQSSLQKGCVSKSICDHFTALNSSFNGTTCCEGNLCNDVNSVTQNNTQSGTQNNTQSGTQNNTQSGTQNNTQSGTQNNTQSGTQNNTQSGTQSNSAESVRPQSFLFLLSLLFSAILHLVALNTAALHILQ
ncbi:hypothetical protein QQF64_018082 [Cirrhinus molitorella]|uniref:Uncharacterized protein n=2 Tax=Cirrhinus molitorella TaxID=172907 RepID=A0ABR3LNQ9_9TELE|nr:hypothetical protein Q8A67_022225 [Cirrhinus molitorella]